MVGRLRCRKASIACRYYATKHHHSNFIHKIRPKFIVNGIAWVLQYVDHKRAGDRITRCDAPKYDLAENVRDITEKL